MTTRKTTVTKAPIKKAPTTRTPRAKKTTDDTANRRIEVRKRETSHIFQNEYVGFSMYTLENRAIPSIIDGLKPSARKIINSAFHILSETKKTNLIDLVGSTLGYSKYQHGDTSLENTIYQLGLNYSDNLAPLHLQGSLGTIKSKDSASPRYLYVKLSKYSRLLKKNSEILEYNYAGTYKLEPKYYLPIIPLILTNRTTGIGVGFAYNNYISYCPLSIIDECLNLLQKGKMLNPLTARIMQYNGTFERTEEGILAKGIYKAKSKYNWLVSEFSPNETYVTYEANLNKLVEKNVIISWSDESNKDDMCYSIKFDEKLLKKPIDEIEKILKINVLLKNPKSFPILNEHNKLMELYDENEIMEYFVNFRLKKYDTLKEHIINEIKNNIKKNEDLAKFIDLYLKGKIKFSKDISLSETVRQIESFDLPSYLIDTRLSKLTKDEYDKLLKENAELKKQLDYTIKTEPKKMYIDDLKSLRKELESDFV